MVVPLASAAAGFLLAAVILPPFLKTTLIVQQTVPAPPVKNVDVPREEVRADKEDMRKDAKNAESSSADSKVAKSEKTEAPTPTAPDQKKPDVAAGIELTMSNGPVEVASLGKKVQEKREITAPGTVPLGTTVRTPPKVKCEFRCPDGATLRLNDNTEIDLLAERQVQLRRGQVWSEIPAGKEPREPLEIHAADVVIRSRDGQFDVQTGTKETQLTVLDGKAEISGGAKKVSSFEVLKGQVARVEHGEVSRIEQRSPSDLLADTKWVNDILACKSADDPELGRRLQDTWANSDAKLQAVTEEECRRFGERCVPALTRYLQSEQSRKTAHQRAAAARVVSDLAPSWAIPDLIELLRNPDGDVRFYASTALKRLTGHTQGIAPEQWRVLATKELKESQGKAAMKNEKEITPEKSDKAMAPEAGYDAWKRWWEKNKSRYPARP